MATVKAEDVTALHQRTIVKGDGNMSKKGSSGH